MWGEEGPEAKCLLKKGLVSRIYDLRILRVRGEGLEIRVQLIFSLELMVLFEVLPNPLHSGNGVLLLRNTNQISMVILPEEFLHNSSAMLTLLRMLFTFSTGQQGRSVAVFDFPEILTSTRRLLLL